MGRGHCGERLISMLPSRLLRVTRLLAFVLSWGSCGDPLDPKGHVSVTEKHRPDTSRTEVSSAIIERQHILDEEREHLATELGVALPRLTLGPLEDNPPLKERKVEINLLP